MKLRRWGAGPNVAGPGPSELPPINVLVRLSALGDPPGGNRTGLASRLEDVRSAAGSPVRFLVAAPRFPGDVLEPDPGGEWSMSWLTDRGRWDVTVRHQAQVRAATGAPSRAGVRSWWLAQTGPVRRDQRRDFFRVPCALPIDVDVLADPYPTVSGRTVDLSEGGLRCVLPAAELEVGSRVIVRLPLEGSVRAFDGVVRHTRRSSVSRVAGWHRDVALAFDDPRAHGEVLRQAVHRMQLRVRRSG